MILFVGHAESPWMRCARAAARAVARARWFVLGLALGACVDLAVRVFA